MDAHYLISYWILCSTWHIHTCRWCSPNTNHFPFFPPDSPEGGLLCPRPATWNTLLKIWKIHGNATMLAYLETILHVGQHLPFVSFRSFKIHIKDVWTGRMKRISWVSHFLGRVIRARSTPLLIRLHWPPTLGQLQHALVGGQPHDFLSSNVKKCSAKAKKCTFQKAFVAGIHGT